MDENSTQRWSWPVKLIVALGLLILVAVIVIRYYDNLRVIVPPLVIAFLIAFILDPIVDFLTERTRLSRGLATTLVFMVLLIIGLALIATPVAIIPSPNEIAGAVQTVLNDTLASINEFFERPLEIGEYEFDLSGVYEELSRSVQSYTSSVLQGTLAIAGSIAGGAFWLIFILIASFYLVKDIDRLVEQMEDLTPPGYRQDFVRLRGQIRNVWHAFFRGQLLLAVILAVVTTLVFSAVGLPFAWVMGLLSGIMAFIPNIGQIVAAVPPILMAFLQGSTYLRMSNVGFGVMVTVMYVVLTFLYNNVLVPRILGRSLRLHPLMVLIAAIVGGLLGGILGMLLAAPTLSTLRIIFHYVISRLYDRDPFAELEQEPPSPSQSRPLRRTVRVLLDRRRQRTEGTDTEHV
jgi:predicted PurR-regulated permease PerM